MKSVPSSKVRLQFMMSLIFTNSLLVIFIKIPILIKSKNNTDEYRIYLGLPIVLEKKRYVIMDVNIYNNKADI